MKKSLFVLGLLMSLSSLTGCNKKDASKLIKVCASETPHAEILNDAIKPLLAEKGYQLEVTTLDWTIQNQSTFDGDYDANYFQHKPYLQQFDSNSANYNESYTYSKLFPTTAIHFEPLRIYEGKSNATDFENNKQTASFEICADPSNAIRALDLLVNAGVISSYEKDSSGNPKEDTLPSRIKLISEEMLVANIKDYDYAVLPCNTALTGNVKVNESLPTESDEVKELRANVIAASVNKYKEDTTYKAKIDALTDCALDSSVSKYIKEKYNGVITPVLIDYRK